MAWVTPIIYTRRFWSGMNFMILWVWYYFNPMQSQEKYRVLQISIPFLSMQPGKSGKGCASFPPPFILPGHMPSAWGSWWRWGPLSHNPGQVVMWVCRWELNGIRKPHLKIRGLPDFSPPICPCPHQHASSRAPKGTTHVEGIWSGMFQERSTHAYLPPLLTAWSSMIFLYWGRGVGTVFFFFFLIFSLPKIHT